MTIPNEVLDKLRDYDVAYQGHRSAGVSLCILVKRSAGWTPDDCIEIAESGAKMMNQIAVADARNDLRARVGRQQLKEFFRKVFFDAGCESIYMEEIPNEYWPEAYAFEKLASPWFMVTTRVGHFKIGWRKNVIVLDWERTTLSADGAVVFAEESTTKDRRMIHCHGYDKLREYLKKLVPKEPDEYR